MAKSEHLRIRIRSDLLEKIDQACAVEGRTRTGEISRRLEQSFERDEMAMGVRNLLEEVLASERKRLAPGGPLWWNC